MEAATTAPARIRYYWKPGCSSCLRTKEFLVKQGIAFESVNALEHAGALDELRALGARGLPVITLGKRFTLCQSFGDVLKFLDLKVRVAEPLAPEELRKKVGIVLEAAARYTRQFPPEQLHQNFRDRPRTQGALAFHIFKVVDMGISAAQGKGMDVEGFSELPPPGWTGEDIARWGLQVREMALAWWAGQSHSSFTRTVPTYYGEREVHDVLERMTWHAAQHTRQLILMLEHGGIQADRPLTEDDLRGLWLPDEVWG